MYIVLTQHVSVYSVDCWPCTPVYIVLTHPVLCMSPEISCDYFINNSCIVHKYQNYIYFLRIFDECCMFWMINNKLEYILKCKILLITYSSLRTFNLKSLLNLGRSNFTLKKSFKTLIFLLKLREVCTLSPHVYFFDFFCFSWQFFI